MNFPVNDRKATDAAARLVDRSGADVDYLRIVKLAYLADRQSLLSRGIPIFGGKYFSMRKGPTISELMNFVGQRNAPRWKDVISTRRGNALNLIGHTEFATLTNEEIAILDCVVEQHFHRSTEDLVEWCHENCPEYEDVHFWQRKPITVEQILSAEGRTRDEIESVTQRAEDLAALNAMLA